MESIAFFQFVKYTYYSAIVITWVFAQHHQQIFSAETQTEKNMLLSRNFIIRVVTHFSNISYVDFDVIRLLMYNYYNSLYHLFYIYYIQVTYNRYDYKFFFTVDNDKLNSFTSVCDILSAPILIPDTYFFFLLRLFWVERQVCYI